MKYFVLSLLGEQVFLFEKNILEEFLEYLFRKIAFRFQNLFQTFGNIGFQEYIGLEIFGKIPHDFKIV